MKMAKMQMALYECKLVTSFEELMEDAATTLSSKEFKQFLDDISVVLADYEEKMNGNVD